MGELLAAMGFAAPIALIVILILESTIFKDPPLVDKNRCHYNEWYCSHGGGCESHKACNKNTPCDVHR